MEITPEVIKMVMKLVKESTSNNSKNQQLNVNQNAPKGGKNKGQPIEIILRKITTGNRKLYYDRNENAYIEVQDIKQSQAINTYLIKVNSEEFKTWLTYECIASYSKTPSNSHLEGIKRFVSREAILNGQEIELHNRIASIKGVIYIDLGTVTRNMVKVDAQGWEIGSYPIFFKRYSHMTELPNPVKGGDINEILQYFPKLPERDQCLTLCWWIASFVAHIERAFLLIEGPPGTGKTTLGGILKTFIDPMDNPALSFNDNENEVAQIIDHQFVPFFDNLTTISRKVSDLICRSFSGGSHFKKELYTDDKDFILKLSGNAIFTAIKLLKPKGDFLDRTYKVKIDKTPTSSRSREIFENEFKEAKPRIFGALLDTISATLKQVQHVQPKGTYRTVDFDRYATAAAEVMGYGADFFLNARKHSENIKLKSITDDTPLIEALSNFLKANNNNYSGYMGKLLQQLPKHTDSPDELPIKAPVLSRRINEIIPELNAVGITAERNQHNDHNGRRWNFMLTDNKDVPEIIPSEVTLPEQALTSDHDQDNQDLLPESLREPEAIQVPPDTNPFTIDLLSDISIQNTVSSDKNNEIDSNTQKLLKDFLL